MILSDNGENVISRTIPIMLRSSMRDNTISGAGQLGDGQMTLVNGGTIAATRTHAPSSTLYAKRRAELLNARGDR